MDSENEIRKDDIYSTTCFSDFPFSSCKRKNENMYNASYFYFSFFVRGLRKRKRILRYPFPIFYHEIEKNEKPKDGIYTDRSSMDLIVLFVLNFSLGRVYHIYQYMLISTFPLIYHHHPGNSLRMSYETRSLEKLSISKFFIARNFTVLWSDTDGLVYSNSIWVQIRQWSLSVYLRTALLRWSVGWDVRMTSNTEEVLSSTRVGWSINWCIYYAVSI